jgi:hypothetical protein
MPECCMHAFILLIQQNNTKIDSSCAESFICISFIIAHNAWINAYSLEYIDKNLLI